jgi:membrane-bound lytic murein transglycosylase D
VSILNIKVNLNAHQQKLVFFVGFCALYVFFKCFLISPTKNELSYANTNFYVLDLSIPANLDFCGEKIPANNYEIRDDLKKEFFSSAYWKTNSQVLFRKAQKWFPYIEPILKQEGVPDDFKYLAVIESHLSNVTSPAGASGFWQLVPSSARNYGLEVNDNVDERYHVEKATHAACKHIKDAYAIFKNWTLSAAAYNLGIGGILNAIKRQKTNNYFDLLLNRETGSFVYRILAYKTLFASPGHFGIKKKKWSYFSKISFSTFKVDSSITDLSAFAKHIGSSIEIIKNFNPWLLQNTLNNPDKKIYEIRIPKNTRADYSSYVADLKCENNLYAPNEYTALNNVSLLDTSVSHTATNTIISDITTIYHLVKDNESIKQIAESYNVKEEDIVAWNNLNDLKQAVKGQTLIIKGSSKK